MPLPAHTLHAAAGLGIDEGTRAEHVEFAARNLAATNVRMDKRGELSKRYGFTALATTRIDATSPTDGGKLFADRDTPCRVADGQLDAYSSKAAAWKQLGRVPEVALRLVDLPTTGTASAVADVEYTNGYLAVTWLTDPAAATPDAVVAVIDAATGALVRAPEKLGTADVSAAPLLVVVGNSFVAVHKQGVGTLKAWALDTTSAATITTGWVAFGASLATDIATGAPYAVQSLPGGSARAAVIYVNDSAGANRATVKTFSSSAVLETQTIDTASFTPSVVSIAGVATDTLWIVWNQTTAIRARGLSPLAIGTDLATVATVITMATGTNLLGIAPSTTAGKARIVANDTNTVAQMRTRSITTTAGATAGDGTEVRVVSALAVSRPWNQGGRYYVPVTSDATNTQKTITIVDFTDAVTYVRPVACYAPSLSAVGPATGSIGLEKQCKAVVGATATTRYLGANITRSSVADAAALVAIDYASTKRWQSSTHANSVYLSGGILAYTDGVRVAEAGFLYRPPTPTVTVAGTGITGTFRYVCVYEEVDADGNWHVSGLSNASSSVSPANQTVTVTTRPLSITSRNSTIGPISSSVRVAFYRTATGAVAPYYRLGTSPNDTSALAVTFTDAVADATLTANAKLYSQPGVNGTAQDRRAPPGLSTVVSYNGMLVGASGSDVWYSGQSVSGEGAWFNPIFQVPVPGEGDITALAVMDGTLFIFKRRDVYAISGEPPSDNGATGGLGVARRLAVDIGCIESRSVCTTALGIFFQSDRGIEILTRAQTVEWIGEAYQTTLAAFPIVTSVTVEPVSNTLLVELAASESAGLVTGTGRTIVYDLSMRAWVGADRRKNSAGTADTPSQSACMIYTGTAWRYAWIGANGTVHYENTSSYLDADSTFVTASFQTGWAKHGLQAEQRIWAGIVLFQRNSAAGMKLETAYDYAAFSAANDKTWTEAETLTGLRQLPFAPKSRGQAMSFRFSDTAPAVLGTGQGFTFVGMSFDTAPKQGPSKGIARLDPALRK